jgi:two-component sensor histidine kinase
MLLNAGTVFDENNACSHLLLAIEDITERRAAERKALEQKDLLLAEMQHRVSNSLQIIASILQLKATKVESQETRTHLLDAHARVLSVAAVQRHLMPSGCGETIAVGPYLSKLCETLGESMMGGSGLASLAVASASGTLSSSDAVSVGLIVTECVINAYKHAFPADKTHGRIVVAYEQDGAAWKLSIADNGSGKDNRCPSPAKAGLGTSILNALAQRLDAHVDVVCSKTGTKVIITSKSHLALADVNKAMLRN